jgi:hypothetical protein
MTADPTLDSQLAGRRRGVSIAGVCCAAIMHVVPLVLGAQATSTDSIVAQLNAADWQTRSLAVGAIRLMPQPLPLAIIQPIVALVKREASAPLNAVDEDFGEYLIDLTLVTAETGDKSAIPAVITIGGIEISGSVAAFVASGGPAIFPQIDALPGARTSLAGLVLQVAALMYAQQGAVLSTTDSASIMSRFLAAASSSSFEGRLALTSIAVRVPLPELTPLLTVLAAVDTFQLDPGVFVIRQQAQAAVSTLSPVWSSLSPQALLAALRVQQTSACVGASGSLHGQCQSMSAHLADVSKHLSQGNSNPAQQGIKNFRKSLQQAAADGLATALVSLLDANAAQLSALLGS